jgi:serine/threonine protein kinase
LGAVAVLSSITDVAVCTSEPHLILIASGSGRVSLLENPTASPVQGWDCHGGAALRVGWIGDQPVAWNNVERSPLLWVLGPRGELSPNIIPGNSDVAVCDLGVYVTAGGVLQWGELSADRSIAWIDIDLARVGNYDRETLTAAQNGVVAFLAGNNLHIRAPAKKTWQTHPSYGTRIALSPGGRRLASVRHHEYGSVVHVQKNDAAIELETEHPIPVLPDRVATLQWGRAGRALMVYAGNAHDVRVFSTDDWHPGLWTHSWVAPRFYPPRGVITVPESRDSLNVHSLEGNEPKVWARVLSSVEDSFRLSGDSLRKRGDKVVVFEKAPTRRPTAIYEVIDGPRKDDQTHGPQPAWLKCRLRVPFSDPGESMLARESHDLEDLVAQDGREIDTKWVRALLERVYANNRSELAQLRMLLASRTTSELPATTEVRSGSTHSADSNSAETPTAKAGSIDARELEVPTNQQWIRRWWRRPGDTLFSGRVGGRAVSVELESVAESEWDLRVRIDQQLHEVFFDLGQKHLGNVEDLSADVIDTLRILINARKRRIPEIGATADPILDVLANQFRTSEWMSGRRLRHELNQPKPDDFGKRLAGLVPRLVRRNGIDEQEEYSLTIPGLLIGGGSIQAREVIEALFCAIALRRNRDPDEQWFEAVDLSDLGIGSERLLLAKNIARACLLTGARDDLDVLNAFAMPGDAEMIAAARREEMTFEQYLVHAATERQRHPDLYCVERPWTTAPLWVARDGSQQDYVPPGFLWRHAPVNEVLDNDELEVDSPAPIAEPNLKAPPLKDDRLIIPNYDLLNRLGTGASGDVYRARENRPDGVERAIKVLIPHPFANDQNPEPRFRSEANALLRLQHRAIVRYVHSGVLDTPRAFFLVMEFVNGERLDRCCELMPFEKRVSTIVEILDGIQHAHDNKIFHRDIKPSNVMIRDADQQPVLVDFGLAYLVGDEVDDDRTYVAPGTPGYIPLEVLKDPKRSRDPKHDVFQAGVMLYRIIMGQLPNDLDVSLETVDARFRDLDPVVRRAITNNPNERFATAAGFAVQLREWLQRDERRRSGPPRSAVTERLARAHSEKLRRLADEDRSREAQQQALEQLVNPLHRQILEDAEGAVLELYESIAAITPYLTLRPANEVEVDPAGAEFTPITQFVYSNIDRTISISQLRRGSDVWRSAESQLRGINAFKEEGATIASWWGVWTSGKAQSPNLLLWGALAVRVEKHPAPTVSLYAVERLNSRPQRLENEQVKDRFLEWLGAALHLEHD